MNSILLILGAENGDFAKGAYNRGLFETASSLLGQTKKVETTIIVDGFDVDEEIQKFKRADAIIFQYPIYWFMMPPSLKSYIDQVYAYDEFYTFNDGPYATGGLMGGRKYMLSTTWNAPIEAFGEQNGLLEGRTASDVISPMRMTQEYCALEPLPHFFCHNIVKDPQFSADNARYKQHLASVFGL